MKNYTLLFFGIMMMLYACESSVTYKGSWYATTNDGKKYKIKINDKTITIKDSTGKSEQINYKENSSSKNTLNESYILQLSNGNNYLVSFNHADINKYGVILGNDGNPLYAISRNDYTNFDYICKRYLDLNR